MHSSSNLQVPHVRHLILCCDLNLLLSEWSWECFLLTFWRLTTCSLGTLTKYSRRSLIGNAHRLLDRHIYSRASLMQLVSKLIISSESYSSRLILFVKYTELEGVYRLKCESKMPVLPTRVYWNLFAHCFCKVQKINQSADLLNYSLQFGNGRPRKSHRVNFMPAQMHISVYRF